jgi:hypothetical protein
MTVDVARAVAAAVSDPELISGREDAGRICVGTLAGTPLTARSLVIRIGERFTTVVFATGSQPAVFWNLDHSAVMISAAQSAAANATAAHTADGLRAAAAAAIAGSRLRLVRGTPCRILAISNMASAIITLAAEGGGSATPTQLRAATDTLVDSWTDGRVRGFPRGWVGVIMVGAAVLEAIMVGVGAELITVVGGAGATSTSIAPPEPRPVAAVAGGARNRRG